MNFDDLTEAQKNLASTILPATSQEIAEHYDVSRASARRRISDLRKKGYGVENCEDGKYRITGYHDFPEEDENGEEEEVNQELKDREAYIISNLPSSEGELAEELGVPKRVIGAYIDEIEDKGYEIEYDEKNDAYFDPTGEIKQKIGSTNMGQITKQANDWLTATEDKQIRQARSITPVTAVQDPTEKGEDIVALLSDVHVGQNVTSHRGETVYGEEDWREAMRVFGHKCISIPERMVSPNINFDTFHLVLDGDLVTNENIYNHQVEDVGAYIADQIDICLDELIPVILSLAEHYSIVNVVCQVGNHGEMRAKGQTRQANADLFVYRELKRVLSYTEYENVNFQVGEATPYKLFELRGGEWDALATHGENAYEQITGTSASSQQMGNWLHGLDVQPDIFYLAHYHEYRQAPVDGIPAIRSPSPKPGGIHEFEIGALQARNADRQVGFIHGVSDKRRKTWESIIDLK